MSGLSYKDSGVDLDKYEQAMQKLPPLMKRTHSSRVMELTGGFAGLFRLNGETSYNRSGVGLGGLMESGPRSRSPCSLRPITPSASTW